MLMLLFLHDAFVHLNKWVLYLFYYIYMVSKNTPNTWMRTFSFILISSFLYHIIIFVVADVDADVFITSNNAIIYKYISFLCLFFLLFHNLLLEVMNYFYFNVICFDDVRVEWAEFLTMRDSGNEMESVWKFSITRALHQTPIFRTFVFWSPQDLQKNVISCIFLIGIFQFSFI